MPEDLAEALDAAGLTDVFVGLSGQNRYSILHRVQTAKRPETRARRIEKVVAMLAAGEKPYRDPSTPRDASAVPRSAARGLRAGGGRGYRAARVRAGTHVDAARDGTARPGQIGVLVSGSGRSAPSTSASASTGRRAGAFGHSAGQHRP